jgi:hypothetical protein
MKLEGIENFPLGERFYKYKIQVKSLSIILETHFHAVISEIEAGLPCVQVEDSKDGDDDEDDHLSKATTWICIICTTSNPMANSRCQICRTAAPVADRKKTKK